MMPPHEISGGIDLSRPSAARVYSYLTGGTAWFPADRAHAEHLISTAPAGIPDARELAGQNRRFILEAAGWAARRGIRQVLDLGAGLPAVPAVHDAAREEEPDAAVAYVDLAPEAALHLRARYRDMKGIAVARADVRDPVAVLAHPAIRELLDLAEPVCLLFGGTLNSMTGSEARRSVAGFARAAAPGSAVAVSCVSFADRGCGDRVAAVLSEAGAWHNHSEPDVQAFFGAARLGVLGGVADLRLWPRLLPAGRAGVIGGVAVKQYRSEPF